MQAALDGIRKEIRDAIGSAVGTDPSLLVIVSITGSFGTRKAAVLAHQYADKAAFGVAKKHLLIRDGLMQKEAKKAKAAPAKK